MGTDNEVEAQNNDAAEGELPASSVVSLVNTKPVTALLTPAATVFGEYLGEIAKETVDRWKATKRAANLKAHTEAVERVLESKIEPEDISIKQAELLFSWSNEAADVDNKEEGEISVLWRSLLLQIKEGKGDNDAILDALKKMTPYDAKLFLKVMIEKDIIIEEKYGKKLTELGLFEKISWYNDRKIIDLTVIEVAIVGFYFLFSKMSTMSFANSASSYSSGSESYRYSFLYYIDYADIFSILQIFCISSFIFLIPRYIYLLTSERFRLSSIGAQLKSSAIRFSSAKG